MRARKEKNSTSFLFSLVLHAIILFVLVMSFDWSSKMPVLENADKNLEVINARVMTAMPAPEKMVPKPPKIIPKPAPIPQPKPKEPIKPQPVQKSVQIPKKNVIAISDKKEKKLKSQKDDIARQMLADIKKQNDKQKQIKQKVLASEFEKDLQQLTVKSLQQQMLQEKQQIAGARAQKVQGEVNKYKALILQAISQNWLVPPSVNKNLSAELMIRVAAGGTVLDVQVVKSSGDESLDYSARTAVFKASPLPVPKDADAFESFRQFVLKVRPKDILNAANWES